MLSCLKIVLLSICQHFFKVHALLLIGRCLTSFCTTHVILPLSLRWIDFIYEVYDFKYLMLYEVTCFEGINEVKILLSEHILGWGQRTSGRLPHSSYIFITKSQWATDLTRVPTSAKSYSVGGILMALTGQTKIFLLFDTGGHLKFCLPWPQIFWYAFSSQKT